MSPREAVALRPPVDGSRHPCRCFTAGIGLMHAND